ncbi:MAG: hypothetical protein JNM26_04630 [Ideonella sp.]|nr:hypothetical protein [Ideonella sp.]
MDADERTGRADRLLGLWSALSVQHVALGSSCACGTGGVSLRLDDFEIDIVDYLEDAGSRSGIPALVAFFEARRESGRPMQFGRAAQRSRPLVDILERIHEGRVDDTVAEWLLPRLERTIDSLAEQHGTRRA